MLPNPIDRLLVRLDRFIVWRNPLLLGEFGYIVVLFALALGGTLVWIVFSVLS